MIFEAITHELENERGNLSSYRNRFSQIKPVNVRDSAQSQAFLDAHAYSRTFKSAFALNALFFRSAINAGLR